MADLAIGLSKSVVEGALTKVQSAIEKDAKLRQKAQGDLVFITLEMEMMQSFLDDANREMKNNLVRTWVKHIRQLAYDVEDCVENVVHLDSKPIFWRRLLPSFMSPDLPLDMAVEEIERLKGRVEDVNNCYRRYNLINVGSTAESMAAPGGTTSLNILVEAAKRQRGLGDLTQLISQNDADLQVIPVWETVGSTDDLEMTTSVIWKAYNDPDICKKFTRRAWVKLTHPFNPHEFTRCFMEGQGGEIVLRQVNKEKYMIVLEDMSTMAEWDAIRRFLPKGDKGSCIIVTTHQFTIASLCIGHPYQLLELEHFSADHSVYAFINTNKGTQRHEHKSEEPDVNSFVSTCSHEAAQEWLAMHQLIGRESEMNDLSEYLMMVRQGLSAPVMFMWGIAGVGKSALVRNLFCSSILNRRHIFEKYGWVDVSYPFNLKDFSRSLLMSFKSASLQDNEAAHHNTMENINPIVECREFLKQYRCLIVIDGLQSIREWDWIQAELVSGSSRNCIIAITTEASVAKSCRGDKGELVFNVKCLQEDAAFYLFKHKASIYYTDLSQREFEELHDLISKFGGLPKIIVTIASSLASKSARPTDYAGSLNHRLMHQQDTNPESVRLMDYVGSLNRRLMPQLETDQELSSLRGIFGWMNSMLLNPPDFLKPCIFYLAIFPQKTTIRRRRLVRRWIGEGYSRESVDRHADENGEKFFSELLELNIFQQVSRSSGKVFYQVNGFIREYIISRQTEENLVFELGDSYAVTTQSRGRHLIILSDWDRDRTVFESIDFSRLRSLTVFGEWDPFFISESMKLLRVLDLENASGVKDDDLKEMLKLFRRLKFLSLRGCTKITYLPSSLGDLRQLQTLDVRNTSIDTLPENITKLQKLQYIRAGTTDVPESKNYSSRFFCKRRRPVGVDLPTRIWKLSSLHTLGVGNVGKVMLEELKKLTQLRKLGVSGINRKNMGKFFSAIEGHVHLQSLSVRLSKGNNEGFLADIINMPHKNLESLKLHGVVKGRLPARLSDHLPKLAKLDLAMASFTEDDMRLLGILPQLCILRVKQFQDGQLCFHVILNGDEVDSYQKVKVLQVSCGYSSTDLQLKFGSEALKKLELLRLDCCDGWASFLCSGLENLRELKQVVLVNSSNAEALKEQLERQLTEHPSSVKPVMMSM